MITAVTMRRPEARLLSAVEDGVQSVAAKLFLCARELLVPLLCELVPYFQARRIHPTLRAYADSGYLNLRG